MIYYSTNWMGPINLKWLKDNGFDWRGGRIDVRGDNLGPYGEEIGVPVIDSDSWYKLQEWCHTYRTEEIDWDILNTFQNNTGHKIKFWRKHES